MKNSEFRFFLWEESIVLMRWTSCNVYSPLQEKATSSLLIEPVHLVFDFSEKTLSPHVLCQTEQFTFVTGLNFDFFGVEGSSQTRCFIFGIAEEHWLNCKTENEVGSMLYYASKHHQNEGALILNVRLIDMNADNCSGQDKNRHHLCYLLWQNIMGYVEELFFQFLVAWHTKKSSKAVFGLVKKRLR